MKHKTNRKRKISEETWKEIKLAYQTGAVGLREIARNMAVPAGTVLARAHREKWKQELDAAKAKHVQQSEAIVPTVTEAIGQSLADDSSVTKRGYSKAIRRHAEHVANADVEKIADQAAKIRDLATTASKIHDWGASDGNVEINIFAPGVNLANPIEITGNETLPEA